MEMVLVNDECFGDYVQTLVDLRRELLVAFRKLLGELFVGKPVLDYACGKTVKVSLPFAFSF